MMSASIRYSSLIAVCLLAANTAAEVHSWTSASYSKSHVVKPGKILEVCADVAARQSVGWKFSAEGDVDFNIHRHEGAGGKQVVYDVEAPRVRERSGKLAHPMGYEWCWMWSNKSSNEVRVQVELTR